MQTIVVRGEGIMLDLLLYRVHGAAGQTLINRALELNSGIADQGEVLPLGTAVIIPDLPVARAETPVITLFG